MPIPPCMCTAVCATRWPASAAQNLAVATAASTPEAPEAPASLAASRQAAWLLSSGEPGSDTAVAVAKFWAAEAGHRVAHTAVHVHGGMGIDVTYPVHRYFVAAKRYEFALGGATAQLLRIGGTLAG